EQFPPVQLPPRPPQPESAPIVLPAQVTPGPTPPPATPAGAAGPEVPVVPVSRESTAPKTVSKRTATRPMESPWLLNMGMAGGQTHLTAVLRPRTAGQAVAEFRVLCDRIEMRAPDGTVQAIGKVTFIGAGLRGTCQRLTLPLGETRIIFEENV